MNKIIISDASTLILLEKIILLDKLTKYFKFIVSPEVYNEAVVEGKKIKSKDAYLIEKKVHENIIKIKKIRNKKKVKQIINEFGLGIGETEAIALFFQEKADVLAIDDHKAINVCKIYQIPFVTALTFVITAVKAKLIIQNEAEEMVKNLARYGRYKNELIFQALNNIGGKK